MQGFSSTYTKRENHKCILPKLSAVTSPISWLNLDLVTPAVVVMFTQFS